MKTKKLFLCTVMVVLALTLFEYANAELEFRSNSKVSLKLAENLDDMNTECIKLKSIIKKKLKPQA